MLACVAGGRSPENLQLEEDFVPRGREGGFILFPMARTARGTFVMSCRIGGESAHPVESVLIVKLLKSLLGKRAQDRALK